MNDLLEVKNLSKQFGGVAANAGIELAVGATEIHALIGPNGAGKTTFIAQLSGLLAPDAGDIRFEGRSILAASAHQRVHAGLARSFQITSIFPRFTVLDNLVLAVQARTGSSLAFWRPRENETALFDAARQAAIEAGLGEKLHELAGALAHGEQRQLEVGLALATQARLLLLDEPMAGLGPEESERMIELLLRLKGRLAMLLVEHDMDAVFRLADRISVLVSGRIIASGAPADIRAHPLVRQAYLGDDLAA